MSAAGRRARRPAHRARSFEEGIRLPVIRIARGGEIDQDLLELDRLEHARSRGAHPRSQDTDRDQRAGPTCCSSSRRAWVGRRWSERSRTSSPTRGGACKNRIAALPDGEYRFERAMDDDGFPVTRCRSCARLASGGNARTRFRRVRPGGARRHQPAGQRPEGIRLLLRQGRARSGPDAEPGHHRSHPHHCAARAPS